MRVTNRFTEIALLAGLALSASLLRAQTAPQVKRILVGAGKSYLIDAPADVERVSIAAPETAEAVPVSTRTVMINGKAPGETSAVLWLSDGTRTEYDVSVSVSAARMDAAKAQIRKEFGDAVQLTGDSAAVYLTGTVQNMFASERAQSIAATIGKVVNLLKVEVPAQEQQILLKVRFADVDRSKSLNLGANFIGTPGGYPANLTTGASTPSRFANVGSGPATFSLSDALNILMFDPHLNIGATIQALEAQNVLQILAEPNVLAMNGHLASFVAGGEFPYPTLQGGGAGVGQVTIQFQEFGIKLRFLPTITARGTIRLLVAPEVSSLDYADALTVEGGTVPALTTRKVQTEVELADGQSFAIAGLLDQQTTDVLSKIPGLGDIPILGKLFTSKSITRSNSELMVIVTPELVSPIPAGKVAPDIEFPEKFLSGAGVPTTAPQTPGPASTGAPPAMAVRNEVSVQEMQKILADEKAEQTAAAAMSAGSGVATYSGGGGGGGTSFGPPDQTAAPSAPAAASAPGQNP